uniref:ZP domain-containing protein n=1 Tax=Haemonchus placei TaxID=6290 RepID=A0A0N4VXA1_HAEPC
LDGQDLRPGSVCNDLFTIRIPCDGSQNVTKLRSKSNWLLLELRSDPYSESSVTGPLLRHRLRRTQTGVRIYSEGMTSPAFLPSIAAIALALIVVRIF